MPLLAMLAFSCGTLPPPALQLSDYSKSCTVDADCAAVYVGALCQVCGGCQNAAINVSDLAKRDADASEASRSCPPRQGPQPACAPCQARTATCDAGTCALKPIN
ncbi:MAG: hypothetical protein ABTQ32_11725 [Myxococcaceae bacterium]